VTVLKGKIPQMDRYLGQPFGILSCFVGLGGDHLLPSHLDLSGDVQNPSHPLSDL
jgi:hypothetical protein